ncbi:BnaC01g40310D [Brassica napus]|uniref:ADP-ribosyl cyclase/cyclic ADP-ribose hydrolase n=1 Tax=Brassica napus TaxID=3708 RepID=A0A078GXM2_BRANA|nr:BnaC01g40310D [Brassica napus]
MDLYLLLVTVASTMFTLLCSKIFSIVYAKFIVQENKIIAYSSSSPPSPKSSLPRNCIHDVFPSFHGADVRKSFLSHFLKELGSKGINLFTDKEIHRGEFIGPELKKAIQGSRIAIVLLSKRYASSSWCLDELVEIMKCKEELDQTVMPIFYEVDPSDVKKQAGEFWKVFKETCKGKTNEVIGKWSQALAKVATLAGYHSMNWDNDVKMIEDVATEVANKLFNSTPSRDFDEFIGMEAHMNKISPVLRTDLDEVRMIGIWGPAGIGKTTIARCLFNQLSHSFQHSVFLMNVKAMYTPPVCSDDYNVKLHLQQKLLSQLINEKEEDFKISHLGVARERLNDKKVLVVLDNVDRLVQLQAMAKETGWFDVLYVCFWSKKVVEHLSKRFTDVRQRLNVLAEKSVISLESERVSMHDLLVQLGRDIVRKQSTEPGQRQFLVDNREICEVLADDAAGSRSVIGILFRGDEIYMSERAFEGMSNLQFLRLNVGPDGGGEAFHLFGGPSYLSRKLRLLDWSYFPMTCLHCIPNPELFVELIMYGSKLEKLWDGTKPLRNLKWVDLSDSKNLKDVSSLSTATSLQELNLTRCSSLVELPSSIGNAIHLKKLDLSGCSSLVELPSSIGNATNLQFLSLHRCSSIVELPSSIGNAIGNLEDLDFSDCSSLVGVPSSIGNATNLKRLYFRRCSSLVELPASIGDLHKLHSLILRECRKLEVLPVNINLKSLTTLELTDCSLMQCFPEISTNIESMYLTGTAIKQVPSSIRSWPRLDELHLSYSENLKESVHEQHRNTRDFSLDQKNLSSSSTCTRRMQEAFSLERLDFSFLNQKIDLNFAKCFKLNKEARDVIIQTSTNYKVTILPGKEMPNYFNYQANGGSLVMKLNERTSSSSMTCKACILLVSKDEVEAAIGRMVNVIHGIKQNSLDVPCNPSYHTLFRPLTEHLYIFEFEADVTSDELCFEFKVDRDEWMIKECGVHYLNTS